MPLKRSLTGYQGDNDEIIRSRIHQWQERANRPPTPKKKDKRKAPSPSRKRLSSPGKKFEILPQKPPEIDVEEDGSTADGATITQICLTGRQRPILKNREGSLTCGEPDIPKDHVKFTRQVLMEEMKRTIEKDNRGEKATIAFEGPPRIEGKTGYIVPPRSQYCSSSHPMSRIVNVKSMYQNPQSSLQASMDRICQGEERPSSAPRNLTSHENKLLRLAKRGNVTCVQRFLTSRPKTDVNARNFKGETALRLAVKMGHEALVCFLSTLKGICLDDVLLYAIRYKQCAIVKLLCETFDLDRQCSANREFPKWVTPLSLAAEVGSYEIIEYLLKSRCHTLIPEPHNISCRCRVVCSHIKQDDQLEETLRSLHIYSALSHPSYYIHWNVDPFTHSFKLYRELVKASECFVDFKPYFIKLAERTHQFAEDLIAECRESVEVKLILSRSVGAKFFWQRIERNGMPTLMKALDQNHKGFIAQPTVQVALKEIWVGDFHVWNTYSSFMKAYLSMQRMCQIPYIYYLLLANPQSKDAHHYALPVNKMLNALACYVLFLAFIFYANIKTRPETRDPYSATSVEFYIGLFVLAYSLGFIRQAFAMHPMRFFLHGWNLYDFSTLFAFWLTIAFWISSQIHYYMIDDEMKDLERKYWAGLDPVLMADGFFVIGSVLAYLKLLFYLQLDYRFGPMQIAMDSMVKEFIKYSVFWLVILLSFTVALGKFYSYYEGMKYVDADSGNALRQEDSFVNFKSTFKTLFFGIFGLASYSTADVVIENIKSGNGTYLNEHNFTEFIGYFALGSYTVMMGIVVMNMVIATMGAAFARVMTDVDTEMVFNNARIYMYYSCQSVLPPPFNLLPHQYAWTMDRIKMLPRQKCEPPPKDPPTFDEVVKRLILRYFNTKAREGRKKA